MSYRDYSLPPFCFFTNLKERFSFLTGRVNIQWNKGCDGERSAYMDNPKL